MHQVKVTVNQSARAENDRIAAANRELFQARGLRVFNMIGAPGCGKTAILERTAGMLGPALAVIEGDVKTDLDARRIIARGCRAVQIETGGGCHLNAAMVADALNKLDLAGVRVLVIENVGNLVCPAAYDLGETAKVAVTSTAEGDEKPVKYPALFVRADAVLINKIDLAGILEYDLARVNADCRKLNPAVKLFEVSAKTGAGFDGWIAYLRGA